MANIRSAIKRTRTTARKTAVNKMQKSKLRTLLKKTQAALIHSEDGAQDLMRQTQKSLDQAVARGLLHRNNAARKMSRLARLAQSAPDKS